ncbi:hypothetical protein PoB_005489800 [Plakobranchus ocellatus]|uniref:CRAL-TRIO domain-containing protein n=1 Tax=Plakobranchus ocellatus TaxID=259542 RepID=A0AAV4CBP1_9GAST|nr:hypothetical protein PoB_005489800 [Plakobranchus ocellatus]
MSNKKSKVMHMCVMSPSVGKDTVVLIDLQGLYRKASTSQLVSQKGTVSDARALSTPFRYVAAFRFFCLHFLHIVQGEPRYTSQSFTFFAIVDSYRKAFDLPLRTEGVMAILP